jgi:curved DNA-binding protein CbpA
MKKKNPYETLNVPKDATQAEIKKAYHKKAKKEHPDVGGDEDTFKATSNAYALLADPRKREYYDKHGDEMPSSDSIESKANRLLNELIDQMLANFTPEKILKIDFIKTMTGSITDNLNKLKEEVARQNTIMERLTKLNKIFEEKLTYKGSGHGIPNIFLKNLEQKKNDLMTNLAELDRQQQTLNKAKEILTDFSFEFEPEEDSKEQLERQRSVYTGGGFFGSF